MAEQQSKEIYRRFVDEVINGGNTDAVEDLFSADYVDHSRPPDAPEGLEGVKAIPRMFRGAFPDVTFTIEDMIEEGDIGAGEPNLEANKALIRRYVEEMFNRHDLTGLEEMLAPDYVYHVIGQDIRGVEGYKGTVYPLFEAFPDVENVIQDEVAEGDRVAIRWRAHGTHEGEFMGVPATGRKVELAGITIERIVSDQRVEGWGVPDMVGLMQQLGAVPGGAPVRS